MRKATKLTTRNRIRATGGGEHELPEDFVISKRKLTQIWGGDKSARCWIFCELDGTEG
jgi:hypothetical protein